ncbi:MAG TPA: SOS response-associated peptidase [Clostridia bacterium]|nr:SOS response-associated peptidase [Clostridia bacterium]
MCGRYYIAIEDDELQDIMREVQQKVDAAKLNTVRTGEIFPTNIVPILTPNGAALMKWGFKRFDGKGQIINARSETLLEKPMFRKPLLDGQRCLVPASNYFEWQAQPAGKKVKHTIYDPSARVIYMEGLYRIEEDSDLPVFVILTQDADSDLRIIHERMPVILDSVNAKSWLIGDTSHFHGVKLAYKTSA